MLITKIDSGYVRGFADADGCISGMTITLVNTEKELIERMSDYLNEININHKIVIKKNKGSAKTVYSIQIYGFWNIAKYTDDIGFGMTRKLKRLIEYLHHMLRDGWVYDIRQYEKYLDWKDSKKSQREGAKSLGLALSVFQRRIYKTYPKWTGEQIKLLHKLHDWFSTYNPI